MSVSVLTLRPSFSFRCDALIFLHDMDAVHGDLKLENIMVLDMPPDTVKLVDFGLSSFNHEAVAVAPDGRCVYLTEDRNDGIFYRFVPREPGRLAAGGRLQALVGPAWSPGPGGDPSAALFDARDVLSETAAAAARAWRATGAGWHGSGADAAAELARVERALVCFHALSVPRSKTTFLARST